MIGHSFGAFLAQESVQVRGRFEARHKGSHTANFLNGDLVIKS
jgi:hypothetical protein